AYDGFAAIITAILFIPQGIAYALLAGLPPQVGLYASILPPLTYALFGTSRTLSVGPVSIAAIMIASALAAPNLMQYGSPIQHALILAVEGGLILILMAIFRLGSLVRFISQPVLSGFTSGAALLIIVSQLPQLVGYPSQPAIEGAAFSSYIPLMIGLGSVILLLAMGKPLKQLLKAWRWPTKAIIACQKTAPLLVVVISTSCVLHYDFGSDGSVAIVGPIPDGLPTIQTSFLFYSLDHWLALLPSAAFIAIIAYVESIAIALVTANMRDEK
ncbi:MAG TPA: sodium-independent anion transporter, partial [Gammaproteobacteria bacterium]|nr:sodium-independent anion transporter [Gammaproteobacteria bacterium]